MSRQAASSDWRRWVAGACVVLLSACATNGNLPAAPKVVEAPVLRYKIGPLDVLNVVVWRNPEISGPVTVRSDGYLSMPLIGDVMATGKAPSDLADELKVSLSKLVLDPVVSVVVTTSQGTSSDLVRVIGEVARPQALVYRPNMTLLDALLQAGGLTATADGNSAVLIRAAENGKQYSIKLKDLLKSGDINANAPVMPGDVVTVPTSVF